MGKSGVEGVKETKHYGQTAVSIPYSPAPEREEEEEGGWREFFQNEKDSSV